LLTILSHKYAFVILIPFVGGGFVANVSEEPAENIVSVEV
jgi:hypothetical protein